MRHVRPGAGSAVLPVSGTIHDIMPWGGPAIVIPLALAVAVAVQILINAGGSL